MVLHARSAKTERKTRKTEQDGMSVRSVPSSAFRLTGLTSDVLELPKKNGRTVCGAL
jgi:hypothetical protein